MKAAAGLHRSLRCLCWLLSFGFLLIGQGQAWATHLNVESVPPDIFSSDITVTYVGATGTFTAQGFAATVDLTGAGSPYNILDATGYSLGSFLINMTVDSTGQPISGTLNIDGKVPALGVNTSQSLLAGDVAAFGYGSASDSPFNQFEFLFNVTGGYFASSYPQTFVKLSVPNFDAGKAFTGDFTFDFSNETYASALSDTRATPEPSDLVACVSLGAMGIVYLVRRLRLGSFDRWRLTGHRT